MCTLRLVHRRAKAVTSIQVGCIMSGSAKKKTIYMDDEVVSLSLYLMRAGNKVITKAVIELLDRGSMSLMFGEDKNNELNRLIEMCKLAEVGYRVYKG